MRRVAATRTCQFLWLLLGLTLVVEGRMLPNVVEPCKYTWQLPGEDCWPPIGQSPRCDHLHSEGCAGSPPIAAPKATAGVDEVDEVEALAMGWEDPDCELVPGHLTPIHCQYPSLHVTKGDFSQHVWTEVLEDRTHLQIHCEGCLNWPPTVTQHMNQDQTMTAAAKLELEDPDCKRVPGRLPPFRCQNPTVMKAQGESIQTAKVFEACQYTWQLPGTDCWPPIGQSPHCDHLNGERCGDSSPLGT